MCGGGSVLFSDPRSLCRFSSFHVLDTLSGPDTILSFPGTRGDMNKRVSSLELLLHGSSKPSHCPGCARKCEDLPCLGSGDTGRTRPPGRLEGDGVEGRGRASVPPAPTDSGGPTRARVGGLRASLRWDPHPAAWTLPARPASPCVSEAEPRDQEDFPGLRWTPHSCSEHPITLSSPRLHFYLQSHDLLEQ